MIEVTRKERDRQLRRSDILKAAEHVFGEKGFQRATVQDIAREAQYAAGTVYLYFKDKESLYHSLINAKISVLVALLKEKISRVESAPDKFRVFVDEVLNYFDQNQDFFRIFVAESSRLDWAIQTRTRNAHLENLPLLADLIRIGQRQNFIRGDYDATAIADVFHSIFTTVIFDWLKQKQGAKSLKEMSGFILDIFLDGARKK
ncbi:MAG: TetR/AcrR family transcriptional regulator [Deltaproteobacteria bacterium]